MLKLEHTWSDKIHQLMKDAEWTESTATKQRWLKEMNCQDNVTSQITICLSENVIYLHLERCTDGVLFTAGKKIKIVAFSDFCKKL